LRSSPDTTGAPDPGWQNIDGNPLASIATARLTDADRYVGGNPAITTDVLIGLAEYTNANFFSEDRVFTENEVDPLKRFPYPNRASVTEQDFDVSIRGATVKRRYFVKTADGATGYRLATVGLLRDYQQRFNLDWTRFRESPALDEAVYRDYAQRLVPRAVAYSAASWTTSSAGSWLPPGAMSPSGSGTQATKPWTGRSRCTTTTRATRDVRCRAPSGQEPLRHPSWWKI
jgi:hypothetical protein